MKYLKLFENGFMDVEPEKDSDLYQKIDREIYNILSDRYKPVNLTESEIKTITDMLQVDYSVTRYNNFGNPTAAASSHIGMRTDYSKLNRLDKPYRPHIFSIFKLDDEWYILSYRLYPMADNDYYQCDQWVGLLQCLKNEFKLG